VVVGAGTGAGLAAGGGAPAEAQPRAAASAPAHQHPPRTAAKHTTRQDIRAQHVKVEHAKGLKAKARAKVRTSWDRPVSHYTMTAGFGIDGSRWAHKHSGQDFAVPIGTAVHAAHRGTVVKAGPYGGGDGPAYGNAIVIKNGSQIYSQYAHLSKIKVYVGQHVKVGQTIGLSGNTGNTSGPHLHFEIRTTPDYGSALNPLVFLRHVGVKV
jgi:murein DD-endopeptidase MepM/ murein hydrolase activator NlpD